MKCRRKENMHSKNDVGISKEMAIKSIDTCTEKSKTV